MIDFSSWQRKIKVKRVLNVTNLDYCRAFFLTALAFVIIVGSGGSGSAATIIKVSLITPEGSPWTNLLHQLADEVKNKTNGEVVFKVYAGGISGDETDVLRKMRANRIHAAGFSGVGLGIVQPEIRILEAPLLYRSYAEVDLIKQKLQGEFAVNFEKKGFVLLGFAEVGFVYFFSSVQMTGPQGFQPLKMWAWKEDPVAKTSMEAFGIKTVPLHLTDVNTGLETGMINAFYASPLAAIAFQWHSKVRYVLDYPMVNSTGAFIIQKEIFNRLPDKHKQILRQASAKFCDALVQLARKNNAEALEELKTSGIEFETPTDNQKQLFLESAQKIYATNTGKLYSDELFQRVQEMLKEFRKQ